MVQRIHDGSPSVRDAAVDVVAKYLGRLDHVPLKLYEVVSARIMVGWMNQCLLLHAADTHAFYLGHCCYCAQTSGQAVTRTLL